jgi:hypothetical protein
MSQFNQDAYNQLLKANQKALRRFTIDNGPNWYELSYDLFTSAPLETIGDFWKIVAYTYSWMPTIPDVKAHLIKDPAALLHKLQALKSDDNDVLVPLLHELIPVINNSLVGVSKVLHFISPSLVPIIDRHVLRGWYLFFDEHPEHSIPKLPRHTNPLGQKHITAYLAYRAILMLWAENSGGQFTMRDLELAFFTLSRNTEEIPRVYSLTDNL